MPTTPNVPTSWNSRVRRSAPCETSMKRREVQGVLWSARSFDHSTHTPAVDRAARHPSPSPRAARLQHRQIPLQLPRRHLPVVVVPLLALELEELDINRPEPRLDHLVAL